MTERSRTSLHARALAAVVVALLTLAGCGKDAAEPPTASNTTATTSPSATEEPTDASVSGAVQVVKVEKFGISFELPKGWITLDAKKVLDGGAKNPFLDEMADRLGMTRDQLVQTFSTLVQTLSVSDGGAVHGFLDNVNTVGQNSEVNDDQLRLQLATIGAKPGDIDHAATKAGALTRIPYDLTSKTGFTVHGVALAVHTGDATVIITVSSSTTEKAAKRADDIEASLEKLPGSVPAA